MGPHLQGSLVHCSRIRGKNYEIEKKKDSECTYLDQKGEGVLGARVWGTVYGSSLGQRPWVRSRSRAGPGCRCGGHLENRNRSKPRRPVQPSAGPLYFG